MVVKKTSTRRTSTRRGKVIKVVEKTNPLSVDDLVGQTRLRPASGRDLGEASPASVRSPQTLGEASPATAGAGTGSEVYPTPERKMPAMPGRDVNFNGYVDNRVIPDAGVPTEYSEGILDIEVNGHGLLRPKFTPSDRDIYISTSQIRRFRLRPGDLVGGPCRKPKDNERYWGLLKVEKVNGVAIDKLTTRPIFEKLTPIYPDKQLKLETEPEIFSTRLIDLIAPIGKGQRGLIVSPPKAGKTTVLKQIANGISKNYPELVLMAVLVGERPEEVTDITRSVKGDVIASNFDEPPPVQTHVAEVALERAKRLVEMGKDVVILLDSITRLARAYNLAIPTSGRTLSGGFDPAALYPPKRFFGAARNIEGGGSLTILATALIETGSRMDDLIYEEFKGTGNLELHLSRILEQRRIFPAIDLQKSGTRQEQLLLDKKVYDKVVTMRRMIEMLSPDERTEVILERLRKSKTNKQFLESLNQG
jgi:transcription termination factor Rho